MKRGPGHLQLKADAGTPLLVKEEIRQRSLFGEYFELTKPRLSLLSVITAMVGYLAAQPERNTPVFLGLLVGTCLAAGGASALNQWMEREADARMLRTRDRPVPAGAISPRAALVYGLFLSLTGDFILKIQVNELAAVLALSTQLLYLLVYTPLKRVAYWNTHIGAVPGAIPPLIGWAAAEGGISMLGWILFAILLTWQIPHFMAIAWTYREDYARGGFVMLSVTDPTGRQAAFQAFAFTVLLLLCSFLPMIMGFTSWLYGIVTLLCGIWFLQIAIQFLRHADRDVVARRLFLVSIAYLPLLLSVMLIDRWFLV